MTSFCEHLDRFPPCLVRMVARDPLHRGRRLSLHDIAIASKLSYGLVQRLSRKRTWAGVEVNVLERFCQACSVDMLHIKRKSWYLKRLLKDPDGYQKLAGR